MATVLSLVKTRIFSLLVCGALLMGAFGVVELGAVPTVAAAAPPSIRVSPNPVTSANCSNVTVSGQNFVGGGNVASLFVDGTLEGAADVAPDGTFAISFNACSLAPGKHTAVVDSSPNGLTASRNFHVK